MLSRIINLIIITSSTFSFAQQNTSSLYSYFGIGETKFKGTSEQKAMAGLGILSDSLDVNLLNPASYSALQRTVISLSGGTNINKMTSDNQGSTAQRTSLDYLSFGIPIGKFGTSFGLNPQTAVGYRNEATTENQNSVSLSRYTGNGGANRVFLGGAYQVTTKFSLGLDLNYYFGNINTESKIYMPGTQFGTGIFSELELSGFGFNIGTMYKSKIKNKYDFYLSAIYNPSYNLNYTKNTTFATILEENNSETIDSWIDLPREKRNIKMPTKLSFGLGIGKLHKWLVGVEYSYAEKNTTNPIIWESFSNYQNMENTSFSLGGYYIPKYNSFTNYFHRITYRAGIKYENLGLKINDQEINDIGISTGLSLPIGNNGLSKLTFAFEYGQRGTKSSGLVQENYFNINVGLTITDLWFRRYLFD